MTDVYAHMLDQTLKQEWLATKERVNAAGERVALTTPPIDDDAAWLKHQFARAKQTLPDGECGLPIQQSCPHPNACHSCPHFLTDERYRPVLEEQLTRAEQRVADAERAGHERVAEINRPDVGVDRSYIYDQVDLLEEIRQRRATPVRPAPRPAAERATIESLQARLTGAHEEIARLKAENRKLRERVALALGDAWQAEIELPRAAGEV
jgi:hypothetical protein